jgi:hypothetical protein
MDKHRRRELLREAKLKEQAAAFAALPMSNADFQDLFDMLDRRLPVNGCDHTRRLTVGYLRDRSLPEDAVLRWLGENGGFCDCEVLANSKEAWEACKDYGADS